MSQESLTDISCVPRYVQFTSPVNTAPLSPSSGASLPLNLVALIVSYLDDVADIARVTRTSRLLYYMTLPQLYQKVSLHSYSEIRYVNSKPEGYGSGSPFMMAVNGLVTGNYASMVKDFRLWGQWRELGVEDFALGRVPDSSMMLNTLIRAATDRMSKLRTVSWELDCKPLKTLYQGLATHDTLTSLTLKFPSSRTPRPPIIIPPIPNLRVFKAMDIDPLCYPDDVSLLLLGSKRLEDLRLHFSPRMRREAECSASFEVYFGRCLRAGYVMPVKHIAVQNFYGHQLYGLHHCTNANRMRSMTFIDMFGGVGNTHSVGNRNVFIDSGWNEIPKDAISDFRTVRCNETAIQHADMISKASGMERMYIIGSNLARPCGSPGTKSDLPTPPGMSPTEEHMDLCKRYLEALTRHHGSTLQHLLLSNTWPLTRHDLNGIAEYCPNLSQFGVALQAPNRDTIRTILSSFPRLRALRILDNEYLDLSNDIVAQRVEDLAIDLVETGADDLNHIGIGDRLYIAGPQSIQTGKNKITPRRREVSLGHREDVKNVEIWSLDCLEIMAQPSLPFDP